MNRKECGCYITKECYDSDRYCVTHTDSKTVTSNYLCPEHMGKHLTLVSTIKQEGSTESCKEVTMNDTLTDFVDQLNVFPTLEDFNASSTGEALKWTDLEQDKVYQIVSTRTVNSRLCVRPTGSKTSKIGRAYNSYQLLLC